MRPFDYHRAGSVAEAIELRSGDPESAYLAGGTNLVDLMRLGVSLPSALIDVSRLGLDEITPSDDGGWRIGTNVKNSVLAADPGIRADYPVLSEALLAGASGQLRNAASVGGNLLQRTRCVYFTDATKPCNKREPGSGCPAVAGLHRDLGILGTSEACVATHPGDMAVALAALDARVLVSGPDGDRVVPATGFHRLPGQDPSRDTVLEPAELITGIELPPPGATSRHSTYRKVRDRASYAFALVSVAAGVELSGDRISALTIALGGVSPRPWRARTAEQQLLGTVPDPAVFAAALDAELAAARPLPQNAFKIDLARRTATAVLAELTGVVHDAVRADDGSPS